MRQWRFGVPAGFAVGLAVAGAIIAACSVEDGTIQELGPVTDASSAASDATSITDGGSSRDGAMDAGDAGTPPVDASCGAAFSGGSAIAYPSTKTKTIDGMDDDWGCEAPFQLDSALAMTKHSADGGYEMSDECKFEWSPSELYVYCDVSDPSPGEGTQGNPTLNDSVGFYVSGTLLATRTGNYGTFDHQYAVDWRNTKAEFANTTQLSSPSAFTTAVHTHAGGYAVEGSIDAAVLLSGSSLEGSMTLGFDLEIDDGVNQVEAMIWAQATHGPCGACTGTGCCCTGTGGTNDVAYCDALAFGTLMLHP